jgi:hypothetical protein
MMINDAKFILIFESNFRKYNIETKMISYQSNSTIPFNRPKPPITPGEGNVRAERAQR